MKTQVSKFITLAVLGSLLAGIADETNRQSNIPSANQMQRPRVPRGATRVIKQPDAVTLAKVNAVAPRIKLSSGPKRGKNGPQTLEEAVEYLRTNVGLVCPPALCVEHEGVFYFSGGTSTSIDTNFLSGFAIKKGDTSIYSWENEVAKKGKADD
jgi:hypothetical protein